MFYITTSGINTSSNPDLDNIAGSILGDCLNRFFKRLHDGSTFLGALSIDSDLKTLEKANSADLDPKEFADQIYQIFDKTFSNISIIPDGFVQTSEPKHHWIANLVWQKLASKGLIYKKTHTGPYCSKCCKFYTESQTFDWLKKEIQSKVGIENTVETQNNNENKTDNNKKSSKSGNPKKIEGGIAQSNKCQIHDLEMMQKSCEVYFFKLSAFKDSILEYIQSVNLKTAINVATSAPISQSTSTEAAVHSDSNNQSNKGIIKTTKKPEELKQILMILVENLDDVIISRDIFDQDLESYAQVGQSKTENNDLGVPVWSDSSECAKSVKHSKPSKEADKKTLGESPEGKSDSDNYQYYQNFGEKNLQELEKIRTYLKNIAD